MISHITIIITIIMTKSNRRHFCCCWCLPSFFFLFLINYLMPVVGIMRVMFEMETVLLAHLSPSLFHLSLMDPDSHMVYACVLCIFNREIDDMLTTAIYKVPLYRRPPLGSFTTDDRARRLGQGFAHKPTAFISNIINHGDLLNTKTTTSFVTPTTAVLSTTAVSLSSSSPPLWASIFRRTQPLLAYHYVHPKSSRPIRQYRKYGDPRYINNEVALIKGLYGLITVDFGMVTQSQLESARLAILRRIPRGAFSLVMHTDFEEFPVVKKSPESRMGAGKSNIHHFAYKFTTGVPLFEIFPTGARRLNQAEAEGIFLAGRPFIPLQTAVVPRGRVDEYHVFK